MALESDKNGQRKTVHSGSRGGSKNKLRKQKSQERSSKMSDKIDSTLLAGAKGIPSGYMSARECGDGNRKSSAGGKGSLKRNQKEVWIQNSSSE